MNELERLADLLTKKRQIDSDITSIIRRPSLPSHIGEFIASRIFGIKLEVSATAKGIDGVFIEGPLNGKTVNVKLYGKQEGILDITTHGLTALVVGKWFVQIVTIHMSELAQNVWPRYLDALPFGLVATSRMQPRTTKQSRAQTNQRKNRIVSLFITKSENGKMRSAVPRLSLDTTK